MSYITEHIEEYRRLMNLLEHHLGSSTEVVLHDFANPAESSVVDIRNGFITGRKIGDCTSSLGFRVRQGTAEDGDYYNTITFTKHSSTIRSSSMHIRDNEGKVVGAICLNTDITETLRMEHYLRAYNVYTQEESEHIPEKAFTGNVSDLLDRLIEEATDSIGKEPDKMSRKDKMEFLSYLEQRGAFLISKSGEQICDYLHISKFTFYKYLDSIRNEGDENGGDEKKTKETGDEQKPVETV